MENNWSLEHSKSLADGFHTVVHIILQADIDAAVKTLLSLKADYKTATGKEWKPGQHVANSPSKPAASAPSGGGNADEINEKIVAQGNTVRDLKAKKAPKVNTCSLN